MMNLRGEDNGAKNGKAIENIFIHKQWRNNKQ